MRVATKTTYDAVMFQLANATESLAKASEVVSTTKRINRLSDDPVGLTQVLNIRSFLNNIDQLGRNINTGKAWLAAGESALTGVQDLISSAKALCVQMSSGNVGGNERRSAALTVQNTLDEIISLANTEVSGRYIFAGSDTDSVPFDSSGNYSGDDTAFLVKIGKDSTVAVGSDGEAVFRSSGNDVMQTFTDLVTALENNDVSGIQSALTELDENFSLISNKISDLGSKMIRMEMKESILQDSEISNTERLSILEDADITEAIMDLKAKEVAYQAALAVAAKVLQVSLVDYL